MRNAQVCLSGQWGRAGAAMRNISFRMMFLDTQRVISLAIQKFIMTSRAEFDRLQLERISAFKEFVNDVDTGAFPETSHLVHIDDDELDRFFEGLDKV